MRLTAENVKLNESQISELATILRAPTAQQRMSFRARCDVLCPEGIEVSEVARRLQTTRVTVRKWRGRYVQNGMERLRADPRSGQPRKMSELMVKQVVQATQKEEPPEGRTTGREKQWPSVLRPTLLQSVVFGGPTTCNRTGPKRSRSPNRSAPCRKGEGRLIICPERF